MNAIRSIVCAIFLVSFLPMTSRAQPNGLSAQFLFPLMVRSIETAQVKNPPLVADLKKIAREFDALSVALEKLPGGAPPSYELIFAAYATTINDITRNVNAPSAASDAKALLEDIEIKNKFISGGFGFGVLNKAQVLVRVKTLGPSGQPVRGYEASCSPRRFGRVEPPLFSFGRLTPTEMNIPPGVYTLKITRSNQPVAFRDVTIGMAGTSVEEVEVTVPGAGVK